MPGWPIPRLLPEPILAPAHIEVAVHFLTHEEGGRKSPVRSGYHGQFHYNERDWEMELTFSGKEWVEPGEDTTGNVFFLSPWNHRGQISKGMSFQLREGQRVVARGVVRDVFDF